jgi:predicted transposase YbfD/YdcC
MLSSRSPANRRRSRSKDGSVSQGTSVEGDHGSYRGPNVTVFHDIGWLQDNHRWPGLKSVVMVENERETEGKVETETRFYITSLALLANALGPTIRSHWMVENGLHSVLDMVFRDDECRVRTDNAPFNLAIVRHVALNELRSRKSKESLRMRRKVAGWDERPRRLHRRMNHQSIPLLRPRTLLDVRHEKLEYAELRFDRNLCATDRSLSCRTLSSGGARVRAAHGHFGDERCGLSGIPQSQCFDFGYHRVI